MLNGRKILALYSAVEKSGRAAYTSENSQRVHLCQFHKTKGLVGPYRPGKAYEITSIPVVHNCPPSRPFHDTLCTLYTVRSPVTAVEHVVLLVGGYSRQKIVAFNQGIDPVEILANDHITRV